jgi:adenosine deaminase
MLTLPPLADLHRHLDGSLRPSTVKSLASERRLAIPANLLFYKGMGLSEALARFAFTVSLLDGPGPIRRVASEMCEDALEDGVTTLEIRFAPQLHDAKAPEGIVEAALEGIAGRAGLILCGLYGEPPEQLQRLVRIGAQHPGVVGLDLAGGPHSTHSWGLADYVRPFRAAATKGLGRTVHAGEGRPPQEIKQAIELLGAQRIGHGTTLLEDPAVADLVREHGITVEACPTSNVHTGVIQSVSEHPIGTWLDHGVRVCVNTDNTLLSAIQQSTELHRVRQIPGMSDSKLLATIATGHEACFDGTKALLPIS